ncbi:protoporphyrinogen/coproporphyrinogen oxidase [Roseibium sp. M-1]
MRLQSGDGKEEIVILGAGPAGIAAAYAIAASGKAGVRVVERAGRVGGNAGSFLEEGIWCDFGSHRLHPSTEPEILDKLKDLLGEDLLLRPRHGRIQLAGRWVHFPLKLGDALTSLPLPFALSLITDIFLKPFRRSSASAATFSSTLLKGLGPTICRYFYFPYVEKLWGLKPEALAVKLAERRVSGSSVGKILTKMLRMLPGLRGKTTGRFFYPRQGFGQISEVVAEAALSTGAKLSLDTDILRIDRVGSAVAAVVVESGDGTQQSYAATKVLSSIPVTALVQLIQPEPPKDVLEAARAIRFRGMILVYLFLETDQFSEYDAHYFPELSIPISRMSEPKNYSASSEPEGLTVLCAELPSDPGDHWWSLSDQALGEELAGWLAGVGLPVKASVRKTITRRLRHAYPVYDLGYEENFKRVDAWLDTIDGLVCFGRQGLFAHDNTHHAFAMAYALADCLDHHGGFDSVKWREYRKMFERHTVED